MKRAKMQTERMGLMVSRLIRSMAMMMAGLWLAGLANAVEVSEIVVTGDTEYTRIMFAADERLSHEAFLLMGEGGRRLVDVKLEGGEVALDAHTPPPTLFSQFRGPA